MENTRVLHYEIRRLLGRGAMGEVYEAHDTRLGRLVALKFVAPSLAGDADAARRFEREALSAAALSHPHIATLYALEHDGGRLFIATELLGGETLRARVDRGPLPIAEALPIARDVASALAHAHRRGIVHRDIKPENLMFAEDGDIKVTDFGLALMTQASHLTATHTALGTPSYMAPESLDGSVSGPADVFALGIVLFEMLAGARPFVADTPILTLYQIANADAPALRSRCPESSADIESLVSSMLTKDPEQRPTPPACRHDCRSSPAPCPPGSSRACRTPEREPPGRAPLRLRPSR